MGGWLHKREERKPGRAHSVSGEVPSLLGTCLVSAILIFELYAACSRATVSATQPQRCQWYAFMRVWVLHKSNKELALGRVYNVTREAPSRLPQQCWFACHVAGSLSLASCVAPACATHSPITHELLSLMGMRSHGASERRAARSARLKCDALA